MILVLYYLKKEKEEPVDMMVPEQSEFIFSL